MIEEYNDRITHLENENRAMKSQLLYLIERVSTLERGIQNAPQNGNRRTRSANSNDESPEANNVNGYSHYFNDIENNDVNRVIRDTLEDYSGQKWNIEEKFTEENNSRITNTLIDMVINRIKAIIPYKDYNGACVNALHSGIREKLDFHYKYVRKTVDEEGKKKQNTIQPRRTRKMRLQAKRLKKFNEMKTELIARFALYVEGDCIFEHHSLMSDYESDDENKGKKKRIRPTYRSDRCQALVNTVHDAVALDEEHLEISRTLEGSAVPPKAKKGQSVGLPKWMLKTSQQNQQQTTNGQNGGGSGSTATNNDMVNRSDPISNSNNDRTTLHPIYHPANITVENDLYT